MTRRPPLLLTAFASGASAALPIHVILPSLMPIAPWSISPYPLPAIIVAILASVIRWSTVCIAAFPDLDIMSIHYPINNLRQRMKQLFFSNALLPDGWARNVEIKLDEQGAISDVVTDAPGAGRQVDGAIAVPGMANLHSHAFQRAMAGLGEWRGTGASANDSFWTWREVMYRSLEKLTPDHVQAIAAQLYVEMLEAGFTAVGEFQYVHHQPDGRPYDQLAEMSMQLMDAADKTGIAQTMLPVFYANGGFGGQPVAGAQQRFYNGPARFAELVEACRSHANGHHRTIIGIAPHSLRAVTPETLVEIVGQAGGLPIHMHIAEQRREVEDCISWSGARPVEWLLDHHQVDPAWCLIHATHMEHSETEALAASGAVAGLCPITEANLGDGVFDGVTFGKAGGRFGVGSDSHVRIDLAEELRSLEYSQRLRDLGRNRLVAAGMANGRALFDRAVAGGAQATGQNTGRIAAGCWCDVVSLDPSHPVLCGKSDDNWLNGWLFSGDRACVLDVWVSGKHLVQAGRHTGRDPIARSFGSVMETLFG